MADRSYPSDLLDKSLVRFPPGMKPQLKASARAGYRSLNAEIVARLARDLEKTASEHTA